MVSLRLCILLIVTVEVFRWPVVEEFRDRRDDLDALESWWDSRDREPINMYGRRRVGKSWLFRRFAHGKPAVILVAQQDTTPARAFAAFAGELEPVLGVRPQIAGISDLFTVLYRLARDQKTLVVVDEFPYLLGGTQPERNRSLTSVQAVMEQHRDQSKIKLILAGSLIAEMERLQEPKSPLHGRLRPLLVEPVPFPDASTFLEGAPTARLTRFSVAGGMPRYLALFGLGSLHRSVVANVLDRRSGLFEEIPRLLHGELQSPAVHFGILEALAAGPLGVADIGQKLNQKSSELSPYLNTLKAMRLVESVKPVGASVKQRNTLWRCSDNFVRFWFRFVRPYQPELEAGADPDAYYQSVVEPQLADHAAPVFESEVRRWVRTTYAGRARYVGAWWGNALNAERREKRRQTEEVDVVATSSGKHVEVVGEAKWTNKKMRFDVLEDLLTFKLPAMTEAGYKVTDPDIVLASRSGFTRSLMDAADKNNRVRLVDATDILG